jgi:sugar-specific transcriptional regulator TrmB
MGMSEIHTEIENLLLDGVRPSIVAKELNVPVTWVYPVMKQLERKVLQSNTEVYSPFVTVNS